MATPILADVFGSSVIQSRKQLISMVMSQHAPPLLLRHLEVFQRLNKDESKSCSANATRSISTCNNTVRNSCPISRCRSPPKLMTRQKSSDASSEGYASSKRLDQEDDFSSFQTMLQSRQTISNYKPISSDSAFVPNLQKAMTRAIKLATYAPNHHRTEPTTYHSITTNTKACDHLVDICYNVALYRNLKKKTPKEAQIDAEAKSNKWKNTIAGYVAVTVGNQPIQDDAHRVDVDDEDDFEYWYETLPLRPPETERQLEDYASACASIQNILLSLHSENLGSKWATGPVIRCRSTRKLIGCKEDDAIVGLVMVGSPKVLPKGWRRRRVFRHDIMRDV